MLASLAKRNNIDKTNSYNDSKIFDIFVNEVNSQEKYNKLNGPVLAVPIVAYHSIDNNKTSVACLLKK